MQSLKRLVNLSLLLVLSSCATYRFSDWQANITLPASKDCYGFNVVSGKEERIPAASKKCIDKKARAIWLDSENYKILRGDIERNCLAAKCSEIKGVLDDLFLTLDQALQQVP